jgi:hypothetical protein
MDFTIYLLEHGQLLEDRKKMNQENFHDNIQNIFLSFSQNKTPATIYLFKKLMPNSSPDHLPNTLKNLPLNTSSHSGTSTRNSNTQATIRSSVFLRDGYRCVFCQKNGNCVSLEAAHIVELHLVEKVNFFQLDILDANVVENFFTLCKNCHFYFDRHMLCIEPKDGTLSMPDAFLACSPFKEDYKELRNKIVPLPVIVSYNNSYNKYWPPMKLLEYRFNVYNEANTKRQLSNSFFKFFCDKCHKVYKTETNFNKHVCKTVDSVSSHSNVNLYHTPNKFDNMMKEFANTKISSINAVFDYEETEELENEYYIDCKNYI